MKKYYFVFLVFCVFMLPLHAYAQGNSEEKTEEKKESVSENVEESIVLKAQQRKARWSIGLDLADSTVAFLEPDGIHVPLSLVAGYDFTDNFQAYSSQVMRFPMRGGYVYVPTLGLRVHSNSIYGLTFFLGANVGYKITNVPWLHSGFLMKAYAGSRYVFSFKMYVEGGIGGNFEISANEMSPAYFLVLGYML